MKTRTLLSLFAGIGIYILFSRVILAGSIFLPLVIAILGLVAIRKIIKWIQDKIAASGNDEFVDDTDERAKQAVKEGMDKLRKIRNNTRMIKNNDVAEKIQEICRVGVDILENIKQHPEDLRRAKQFLNYYLDTTEKIVKQYVELSQKRDKNDEINESLAKAEEVLSTIGDTYKKQLHTMMENDVLDLNTEIEVLRKTMKLEG